MDCKPHVFTGADGAVSLIRWIEKVESVFDKCGCPEADKVRYATGTLEGEALTWWNTQVQILGVYMANGTPWNEFKELLTEVYCPRDEVQKLEHEYNNLQMQGADIKGYTTRFNELVTLCPNLTQHNHRKIE